MTSCINRADEDIFDLSCSDFNFSNCFLGIIISSIKCRFSFVDRLLKNAYASFHCGNSFQVNSLILGVSILLLRLIMKLLSGNNLIITKSIWYGFPSRFLSVIAVVEFSNDSVLFADVMNAFKKSLLITVGEGNLFSFLYSCRTRRRQTPLLPFTRQLDPFSFLPQILSFLYRAL